MPHFLSRIMIYCEVTVIKTTATQHKINKKINQLHVTVTGALMGMFCEKYPDVMKWSPSNERVNLNTNNLTLRRAINWNKYKQSDPCWRLTKYKQGLWQQRIGQTVKLQFTSNRRMFKYSLVISLYFFPDTFTFIWFTCRGNLSVSWHLLR